MRDRPITKKPLVRIPAVAADEWTEEALCLDNPPTDPDFCFDCPVMLDCHDLHERLSVDLGRPVPGVWGGTAYPESTTTNSGGGRYPKGSKPVNGGYCVWPLCEGLAYRRGMCNPHYRLDLRNKVVLEDVELEELDNGDKHE